MSNGPTATQLQTINNGTGGTIVVHNRGITLSSTAAVVKEALAGTLQDGNGDGLNGAMTISDGDGTSIAATVLSAIGSATGGTVTVTHAINVTGTADQAIVALHDTTTKVEVSDATVTLTDDPDLTELINLNASLFCPS